MSLVIPGVARATVTALGILAANAPPADAVRADGGFTELSPTPLLDFRYSFPTLVGSDPKLLAAIQTDNAKNRAEALEGAKDDAAIRRPENFPFHQHQFWRDWTIPGQSGRLLSLRSQTETFTGGAHGMHTTGLMLWDKEKKQALRFADLFVSASAFWPLLATEFCKSLASERFRRAQMEGGRCPKPEELVLVPADTTSDWKFDSIQVVADPYVAGSYAEGRYEFPLPVSDAMIAALKPEYRDSFEAQRPQ